MVCFQKLHGRSSLLHLFLVFWHLHLHVHVVNLDKLEGLVYLNGMFLSVKLLDRILYVPELLRVTLFELLV